MTQQALDQSEYIGDPVWDKPKRSVSIPEGIVNYTQWVTTTKPNQQLTLKGAGVGEC